MIRPSPRRRRAPRRTAAGARLGLVLTIGLSGCGATTPLEVPVSGLGLALLAAAVLGVGVLLGWLAAHLGLGQAAHEAEQTARRFDAALTAGGGRTWITDPSHRLVGGTLAADGVAVWQVLDAAGLRETLRRRSTIERLPARRLDDGTWWLLQAQPLFDRRGAFAGHAGSAHPLDDGALLAQALQGLVAAERLRLLVASRPQRAADAPWRIALLTGSGTPWGFATGDTADDEALAQPLPEALRAAVGSTEPGAMQDAEGWHLRRWTLGASTVLLLWQDTADAADRQSQAALAYAVSHDLRAPIRVVEGFARILKEDYGPSLDRIANDHLERVLAAGTRMNQMIDAMLSLGRLGQQPLVRERVDLSRMAEQVVGELQRTEPGRDVRVDIAPGLHTDGDATLWRQVMENLLGNAWKYTAGRSPARIVVEPSTPSADGGGGFVVRDNGAGFDMRAARRLFGLFQRLHSASDFPGTGVGLASVRCIVLLHGGDIKAEGEPGRGAAFHVTLPTGPR